MALNYNSSGFGICGDGGCRLEASRFGRGLATTPSLAEVVAEGCVPDPLLTFMKDHQRRLREAYNAEMDRRDRVQAAVPSVTTTAVVKSVPGKPIGPPRR